MTHYNENPPRSSKDKQFVDELVTQYIATICGHIRLWNIIYSTEQKEPSSTTRDIMEEAYGMLNDTADNKSQLEMLFKTKINY